MTVFNFASVNKRLSLTFSTNTEIKPAVGEDITALYINKKQTISLKDNMYNILSKHINYLNHQNLIPRLKNEVDIIFTNVGYFENLINKFKKNLPPQYSHLACSFPSESKIFLSSSFLTHKNQHLDFSEVFKSFKLQYNNDYHKSLEKEFLHELAHIVINEQYKQQENYDSGLKECLKINIEEAFCETFSLHLMSLKYPNDNFSELQNFIKASSAYNEQIGHNSIYGINVYNIYRVYDYIPLKDNHGRILTDIQEIISGCFQVALKNSESVLLDKMQDPYVKAYIQRDLENYGSPQNIIQLFHQDILKNGISTQISTLRNKSFNENQQNNQFKK